MERLQERHGVSSAAKPPKEIAFLQQAVTSRHAPRQFNQRGACAWLSPVWCQAATSSLDSATDTTMLLEGKVHAAIPAAEPSSSRWSGAFGVGEKYFENVTAGAAFFLLPLNTGNSFPQWRGTKSCQDAKDSVTGNSSV